MHTNIAGSDASSIRFQGHDLVEELIGKHSFTEVFFLLTCGRLPNATETRVLDACLVTLMDHGWTPTSLIARLAYDSAPSQVQIGISAGLLAVGDVFAGTMDGCAKLLAEGIGQADQDAWCRDVVQAHRTLKKPMPGFGHPFHKPDDPRPPRLFKVAAEAGVKGDYVALLQRLGRAVDAGYGRHLTINATGALAALLLEIGMPLAIMRGVSVVSRSAGLAAHIAEEQRSPTARQIWKMVEEEIPYRDPG
ncbi:citryl-CoA lyase [Falsiroseomonas sp. HW251]|uniref:citryl-CoA lyase n=1 Tax=Falsiroseomonas sp. HW251 TaxID=3390998 RepID=UPI003D31AD6E